MTSSIFLSNEGAAMTSTNCFSIIFFISLELGFLLNTIIPPNAEVGSVL